MEWTTCNKEMPEDLELVQVTIEGGDGDRYWNCGYYYEGEWNLVIDAHHYQDCTVIAWRERGDIYRGDEYELRADV